jgi:hypothetical protein
MLRTGREPATRFGVAKRKVLHWGFISVTECPSPHGPPAVGLSQGGLALLLGRDIIESTAHHVEICCGRQAPANGRRPARFKRAVNSGFTRSAIRLSFITQEDSRG